MEALLIDGWLRDLDPLFVDDEASLAVVREALRAAAASAGVAADVTERACLVATELGQNQLRHARGGQIAVRAIARAGAGGLEIVAADRGGGIRDAARALEAAPRTAGSLGVGIGAARRLSSEVDFDVRVGEGTRVAARVLPPDAPRRLEVGVYGRPIGGERVSGDHSAFTRVGDVLLVTVSDGLGHGPLAREASDAAVRTFRDQAREAPARIIEACGPALEGTRGVVMAVAAIDEQAGAIQVASVGNVDARVCAPRSALRFGGVSAVVGARGRQVRPRVEVAPVGPGDVVLLATDGVSSRLTLEEDLALLRAHPIAIAQRVVEQWGRSSDDALVLVAR